MLIVLMIFCVCLSNWHDDLCAGSYEGTTPTCFLVPVYLILFVKDTIQIANCAYATAPISTVSSCSWNNQNFMKWKIAPPQSGLKPMTPHYMPMAELWECDTFQFMVWNTHSGDIDILFIKVNIQNDHSAWATAPVSTVNSRYAWA